MAQPTYSMDHIHVEGDKLYFENKTKLWNTDCYITQEEVNKKTPYEMLKARVDRFPEEPVFGYRHKTNGRFGDYEWINGPQTLQLVDSVAGGLVNLLHLKKGDACGIMTRNRYEWYILQFAMQRQGIIIIPMYGTFGIDALDYIVKKLELKYLFCSPISKGIELAEKNPSLKLVAFDKLTEKELEEVPSDLNILTYEAILNFGQNHPVAIDLPSIDDTYSVIFTSGTSGNPKGVVHTHRTINNAVWSFCSCGYFDKDVVLKGKINYSYLPSAHVYDQQIVLSFVYGYGAVGFNSGGIPTLVDDFQHLHPTFLITVPRVLQKIYDKFIETVSASCIANTVYKIAYYYKSRAVHDNTTTLINWDAIIFNKIKEMLGGQLDVILNGSAPLTQDLFQWLRVCTGAKIFQGYGLTESFGGFCTAAPGLHDDNHTSVGSPCIDCHMRLVSIPDMDYDVHDEEPTGEIQIKAKQIFKEYYGDEAMTKASFTDDGYFCTGDVGRINYDGSISIIDRKKNLFKLAQGEYIAVEPLENLYGLYPLLQNVFIYGESTDTFIVGIIVPEKIEFIKFLQTQCEYQGNSDEELKSFVERKDVRQCVMKELENHIRNKGVPGYEVLKNIYIELTPFSEANNLLTPSFKLRRPQIKKKYADILNKLRNEVINNEF
ncbi:long-chain-fatty-acid--CoA ligase, putative [Entamoeba histolytica HM-1:IMSS-B]|uniref:Long-chain-fatty-acid--CoA ligase, putative n=4 Tax=Entamoeba histolytica TaxID=5759 RepID=C4LSF2_ENTH1|nr:long-chain-fatty-acid--CoA ligase, putative [Entamoeba histolytica HM-1:IMSS]EAL50971.1 long-chain-fatty-acid--CoA ligase, putative [Entamoeba histolytica HM-1:IMSS]EMH77666.1 long-chain-fatty-acid--CoA ligase, putative [Entamoeba histolytica HM-1:IMSS-B]ENY60660.1 long-chain-fatty-acid--CoA ligase, putative [Entamoeba histolytica HM-1:IMSS-A]GAT91625.1 long-chain-fatty-acid--coa ligase putative [Entamoeba histolytica]|eukprot:XP_656354.1 long-chain-fatty-acid--CoA ligase, putative [Entamoeba histolytica HM-1:IMSS]